MMPRHSLSALLLLILACIGIAEDAIQCPPCSQEKLIRCLDPTGCQELVKEPGCGCCATCALSKGALCGVYTTRCGSGLRCYPPRGSDKPLHTLMNGQGICTEIGEIDSIQQSFQITEDDHFNISPCGLQDKKCHQKQQAKIQRNQVNGGSKLVKTFNNVHVTDIRLGSCHGELNRALERLAASQARTQEDFLNIPIPNCDKNGHFNPKQCHPALDGQRGKCWCVDRKTGIKLPGPYDPISDPECQIASENIKK
ncbi:insulin-like growth factor-binding protein 4 [Bombina bombina]|uniref:insulin-like growth factor-binding protein 4 n=1 Tax=Bombina bombina TaxID=8345 RepID=UPI00235ABA48|nr:insulin-like growth factor-binding protein 4 [Bombina bombina]